MLDCTAGPKVVSWLATHIPGKLLPFPEYILSLLADFSNVKLSEGQVLPQDLVYNVDFISVFSVLHPSLQKKKKPQTSMMQLHLFEPV